MTLIYLLIADLPSFSPDGACVLVFRGTISGLEYQIDSSTNLVDWMSRTNLTATGRSLAIRDENSAQFLRRFYRCAELP